LILIGQYILGGAPVFNWHKFGGGESEGGQKFLPPNLLPFCPPELKGSSRFSVRIFIKKSSDFVQGSELWKFLHFISQAVSARGGQAG
jgi:hypothetical protein